MKNFVFVALVLVCNIGSKNANAAWVGGNTDVSQKIESQIVRFSESSIPEFIESDEGFFYGIDQKKLEALDYKELKNSLLAKMNLKTRRMVQIVGSSNPFSVKGTKIVREFLKPHFLGDHMIEFGYTGHINQDSSKLDINSFLNEYVEDNPSEAHRVLANVVGHSVIALNLWGTKVSSLVSNFVVVFNEHGMGEGFTKFGDDVMASDFIMSPEDNDLLVVIEGGAQSFRQAVNVLEKGVQVVALANVREEVEKIVFSAAELFALVRSELEVNPDLSPEDVKEIVKTYLSNHWAWDPRRPDASTKKALFDSAVADFVEKGIYKKLLSDLHVTIAD